MPTTTLFGREWDEQQLRARVSDMAQLGSIRRSELADGKARGAEHLQLNLADGFNISLLPGRCLDVSAASWKGVPLASLTPPGPTHPAFLSDESSPGGFARNFQAGLVYTCGLTSIGGKSPRFRAHTSSLALALLSACLVCPSFLPGTVVRWAALASVSRASPRAGRAEWRARRPCSDARAGFVPPGRAALDLSPVGKRRVRPPGRRSDARSLVSAQPQFGPAAGAARHRSSPSRC